MRTTLTKKWGTAKKYMVLLLAVPLFAFGVGFLNPPKAQAIASAEDYCVKYQPANYHVVYAVYMYMEPAYVEVNCGGQYNYSPFTERCWQVVIWWNGAITHSNWNLCNIPGN